MKRDLSKLAEGCYDVVIIGGGIYGMFAAWDAALRGLSVALLDRGDFGGETSANSLRVIHGGLRYLQHGDIRRMRQSISERTSLMRIAPHLVKPLPFLIPTYGHGMRGKQALSLALKVHDIVGFDRNRHSDAENRLPGSWTISRDECLDMFPGIDKDGLTGAAIYYDAQLQSSERLLISILRSASLAGAEFANYVEVVGLINSPHGVAGVCADDMLTGDKFDIKAKVVLNTAGPWVDKILGLMDKRVSSPRVPLSKAFNLAVNLTLTTEYAFGVYSKDEYTDSSAVVNKGSRMIFITPWHSGSLIGTEHLPYHGDPDDFEITEAEIQDFLSEANHAYPTAELGRDNVTGVYSGLLPAAGYESGHVQLAKYYSVRDHARSDGLDGLISVVGVKFTESRYVAEKAIDLVFRKLGKKSPACTTSKTPVHGGEVGVFTEYLIKECERRSDEFTATSVQSLIKTYGCEYRQVLSYLDSGTLGPETEAEQIRLLRAQVIHSVREEMAQKLSDLVRRIGVSHVMDSDATLRICADMMADELDWDEKRTTSEYEELRGDGPSALVRTSVGTGEVS